MKYCPDCDMEFIDSVQTCTDCGKVLVDKDKYFEGKAARDAEQAAMEEQRRKEALEAMTDEEKEAFREALEDAEQMKGRERAPIPEPTVYVTRAERYEDLKSSASAFWIVGGALAILAVAGWAGLIPVNIIMKLMFTVLAAGSLVIAWKTTQDAKTVKGQIQEEAEVTDQLIRWFLENYTPEMIDEAVRRENGELQDEVLALKRIAFIQDTYITQYDLADQGYVDALAEEVYGRLFEDEEDGDEDEEYEDADEDAGDEDAREDDTRENADGEEADAGDAETTESVAAESVAAKSVAAKSVAGDENTEEESEPTSDKES